MLHLRLQTWRLELRSATLREPNMFHAKAPREFGRRKDDFAVPEDFADFNAASIIPLSYHTRTFRRSNSMLKARSIVLCLIVSLSCVPVLAQTAADKVLLKRIRKEEKDNSQIM